MIVYFCRIGKYVFDKIHNMLSYIAKYAAAIIAAAYLSPL